MGIPDWTTRRRSLVKAVRTADSLIRKAIAAKDMLRDLEENQRRIVEYTNIIRKLKEDIHIKEREVYGLRRSAGSANLARNAYNELSRLKREYREAEDAFRTVGRERMELWRDYKPVNDELTKDVKELYTLLHEYLHA